MSNQHILTHYDEHLDKALSSVVTLGHSVLEQLGNARNLVGEKDEKWSNRIIASCQDISLQQTSILLDCQGIIGRFQPIASDLRLVVSLVKCTEKLGESIEQLGTMARRGKEISRQTDIDNEELIQLVDMAAKELEGALAALELKDKKLAEKVKKEDKALDRFHRSLLEDIIVNTPKKYALPIDVDRIFFVRAVERLGDTAKGIAKAVMAL